VIWTYTPDIAAGMPIVTAALVGFVQLDMVSSPLQSRRKTVRSVGSMIQMFPFFKRVYFAQNQEIKE
jgi:hypothetical protein